jgi:hypothetical protein
MFRKGNLSQPIGFWKGLLVFRHLPGLPVHEHSKRLIGQGQINLMNTNRLQQTCTPSFDQFKPLPRNMPRSLKIWKNPNSALFFSNLGGTSLWPWRLGIFPVRYGESFERLIVVRNDLIPLPPFFIFFKNRFVFLLQVFGILPKRSDELFLVYLPERKEIK